MEIRPFSSSLVRNSLVAAIALSTLTLFGCGPKAFVPLASNESQQAPGSVTIPPKVDIVLLADDTGGITPIREYANQKINQFLTTLSTDPSKDWDFHFVVVRLTTNEAVTSVYTSKHDSNWGSQWTPPYPGAIAGGPGTVNPNVFRTFTPGVTTDFIQNVNSGLGSIEPGLSNMKTTIETRFPGTGFLRSDAMLAVVVLSTGEDTSCTSGSGVCAGTSYDSSVVNTYRDYLVNKKGGNATAVRFYSAVSTYRISNGTCMGYNSYAGNRYKNMANSLGGAQYDICSQDMGGILNDIASNLSATQLLFRTRYLVIGQAPEVSTITVTKNMNGTSVSIPMDSNNGWTYAGYLNNFYLIDYPIPMNQVSGGYAIELHGDAKLIGNDTAQVSFLPEGAQTGVQ
ncbi:MAG: hypothetical protein JNL01_12065 [Bdellovibrionales bacterium]|nr:hypothetical protein [Bdellovibrionales bacterium]